LAFKVIQGHCFQWIQKPVYDFLLVVNSNLGQQNIVWKIREDRSSQTSVACRRSSKTLQWPGKLDFSPFWTACQIWPKLHIGTKQKLGSFLDWAIVYKNAENGPYSIVTEIAKWRESRHFVPKSAALMGGWGPENAWRSSTFSRHTTSKPIVWK